MIIRTDASDFAGSYELVEAACIIRIDIRIPDIQYRVKSSHLIRWIRSGLTHPELISIPGRRLLITFEDLVSMRVIAFLRAQGYSFAKIRRAEADLRRITQHPRPFATQQIWAESMGATNIWAEIGKLLMVAGGHGQLAFLDLVRDNLVNVHDLTFNEKRVANSWQAKPGILLHPRIQFGRPCIAGTRIPTSDIAGMVRSGDSCRSLARSYGISEDQVNRAVFWEQELATA